MIQCPREESNLRHTGIRNPRLYPAELRGQGVLSYQLDPGQTSYACRFNPGSRLFFAMNEPWGSVQVWTHGKKTFYS